MKKSNVLLNEVKIVLRIKMTTTAIVTIATVYEQLYVYMLMLQVWISGCSKGRVSVCSIIKSDIFIMHRHPEIFSSTASHLVLDFSLMPFFHPAPLCVCTISSTHIWGFFLKKKGFLQVKRTRLFQLYIIQFLFYPLSSCYVSHMSINTHLQPNYIQGFYHLRSYTRFLRTISVFC